DENERSAPIDLRVQNAAQPKILSLQASPVSQSAIAPATFRITSEGNNVQTCVWDFGADKPLDISSESPNHQERLVTFDKPGKYWVQLAALTGKQSDRKFVPIDVKAAPPDSLMAVLSVVDQGVRLESRIETVRIALTDDGTAQQFAKSIPVAKG